MICQAFRILLMCCPWVSIIIGWITDVTGGKRQLCFKKLIWVLNSYCFKGAWMKGAADFQKIVKDKG